mgnify:CR=1 FL=1
MWTYTVSTPVMSFLEQVDFQGKEIISFWTDAGSPGNYEQDFRNQAQNAILLPGLGLSNVHGMEETEVNQLLDAWVTTDLTPTDLNEGSK